MLRSTIQLLNNIAVFFAIVLLSVFRFPSDDFRLSMRLLFEVFATLAIVYWTWQINKWVAMFLLLSMVSMIFPFYGQQSYVAFIAIVFGVALYNLSVQYLDTNVAMNAICIVVIINCIYLTFQYFNADPLFVQKGNDFIGLSVALMGNKNLASAIIAIGFPAFLRPKWLFFLPLVAWGLYFAKSSGGVLAVAIAIIAYGLIYYLALEKKSVPEKVRNCGVLIFGMSAVFYAYFYLYDNSTGGLFHNDRVMAWIYALTLYKQHWLMGAGLGHWSIIGHIKRPELQGLWWVNLHNEFLQALFEMGVGFVVILCGYFINILRRIDFKSCAIPLSALVAICANSFVNFPFHIGTTALIGILWLSLLEKSIQSCEARKEAQYESI